MENIAAIVVNLTTKGVMGPVPMKPTVYWTLMERKFFSSL